MTWLPDDVLTRLRAGIRFPDLGASRYRAIELLGSGGMGTVWLAEDLNLNRRVALKVVDAERSAGELAVRLEREAIVLARLEHPGIVPVHDAGLLPDGRAFYCMKYVEGQTLDRYVSHASLSDRLRLLPRVMEPLAFAHSKGIIHRDLKPANIMIGAFGEVLIMDWGLAKVIADSRPNPNEAVRNGYEDGGDGVGTGEGSPAAPSIHHSSSILHTTPATGQGRVLGTPGYMAPEQEHGQNDRVDERADIYALGAILNFLLSCPSDHAAASDSPSGPLRAIRDKAMASRPEERYASVEEMSADMIRYLEGRPVSVYREKLTERAMRLFRRYEVAVVLVLVYLVMRLLLILFSRR
ncbi:MAG TPA: serine/threonine-protein kinase [Candidatus Angelobacter sp.]|nr:serine/threonine-protein kinase [Candidatus Angelobacter sp.]